MSTGCPAPLKQHCFRLLLGPPETPRFGLIWTTDQKVGSSSPSERAERLHRSGPLTGSTHPFTWVDLRCCGSQTGSQRRPTLPPLGVAIRHRRACTLRTAPRPWRTNNSDQCPRGHRVRTTAAPKRRRAAENTIERLLLTVDEAAEALAFSRSTIYRLLKSGDLVATRIGTATRIPEASLRR